MKGVQQQSHKYWKETDSRNFARAVSLDFSNTARNIMGRNCMLASAIPSPGERTAFLLSFLLQSPLQESRNIFALHFILFFIDF